MNLFLQYLKHRHRIFIVGIAFLAVFMISFALFQLPILAVIYPMLLCTVASVFIIIFDFLRVKREHSILQNIRSMMDAMTEVLPDADSIKEEDYQHIIHLINEEYGEYRTETNRRYSDMIDYYTVWVHQIKTPIAAMKLHLQNEDSSLARKLTVDLKRIEQYVEMVLTFLRLNAESTDYVIKELELDKIIKQAVKNFSTEFIDRKLRLVYEPLNTTVITDEKWLSFVIEQVLSNALKYTPSGSITITLENTKTLRIRDTGIGIAPEDLPRIFENGYTGYNGRTDKKASGIGLYLCKRICSKLGHTITAQSIVDVGTIIDIDLAQTKIEVE